MYRSMEETLVAEGNGMDAPSVTTSMAGSGSWVVDMDGDSDSSGVSSSQTSVEMALRRHSIYRVQEYIKTMTNPNAYQPRLVSLGPFHHGEPALLPMEEHKRRAVNHLIKRSSKTRSEIVDSVKEIAEQLQSAYENLDEKWRGEQFVELMVTDGCFLLEVIRVFEKKGKVEDYGYNDPVFSEHGYLYLKAQIISDILLIENQLPLLLLHKLLMCSEADLSTYQDGGGTNKWVLDFLGSTITVGTRVEDHLELPHLGLHILDVLHKSVCGNRQHREGSSDANSVMPSALELREAGMHFKESKDRGFAGAVRFEVSIEGGILSIPKIFFNGNVEHMFLNLMAFEKLHPSAGNYVVAFVYFLDNFINTPKDVALLRSKGILENNLGSDEAVANLINNTLRNGTVMSPDSSLCDVLREVNTYCKKPWNSWRASLIHTYFSNPWVFISLVAATVLLTATVFQAIYAVLSFRNKS